MLDIKTAAVAGVAVAVLAAADTTAVAAPLTTLAGTEVSVQLRRDNRVAPFLGLSVATISDSAVEFQPTLGLDDRVSFDIDFTGLDFDFTLESVTDVDGDGAADPLFVGGTLPGEITQRYVLRGIRSFEIGATATENLTLPSGVGSFDELIDIDGNTLTLTLTGLAFDNPDNLGAAVSRGITPDDVGFSITLENVQSVPLPEPALLLLSGLAGLGFHRCRKRA